MTIERTGRTRYSDESKVTITIRRDRFDKEPLFVLHGASIRIEERYKIVEVMHPTGTDFEHDAASIVLLEFWAITFRDLEAYARTVEFNAVLASAQYYPDDVDPIKQGDADTPAGETCTQCVPSHPFMPYQPPKQKTAPGPVVIEVTFE